jgi:Flp pilus assembly secretin CpaC
MKQPPPPLLPVRSLALIGCLLALLGGLGRAQAPVAEQLDVYFGEPKLLPLEHPIDDFKVVPDNIVKVDKVEGTPNQLSITGVGGGNATLTVKSGGQTFVYAVAVSPAPTRLYINLNESKRLTFPDPIDDTSVSQNGIVRVVQPDSTDRVVLVEANEVGKTTLTVYSKGEIYRYFISTFENRGADVLEIENAFSAKGYRNLKISFDKDQAILEGTVPTQEELDDAVRIVKQFTQFVMDKVQLGQEIETSEYTEEERIIINNIQRIANVKGLTIRVKFPAPTVITTSTYTKSAGDYIAPEVTTTPQGGTVRGSGFNPPKDPNAQGPTGGGALEPKPQENTTEIVRTSQNTSIPEKIFLYGDLQDDLEEAKVIRVARTFCPFIVSFLTVKDPIQIRTQIRFMQFDETKTRNAGFDWSNGGAGPSITLGFGGTAFRYAGAINTMTSLKNFFTYGITGSVNATAVINLYQTLGLSKLLRETELFLTNGQPGWYSEGEVKSYVSSAVTTTSSPPITTLTASAIFLGVNLDISPLNIVQAGGTEPSGQKIFGIPTSVGGSGSSGYNLETNSDPTADTVSKVERTIQRGGSGAPFVDSSVKYVDENGLIGLNISTQLTLPNTFTQADAGNGQFITLPDFFVRTTRTRVNLRDDQTVVINGLIDDQTTRSITSVPFLSSIPLFSTFFKNTTDGASRGEVIVLVTPHIVRMKDADSARIPKPRFPEMQDMARSEGYIPIIKPVRYDVKAVDIRPETPKDFKDAKNDTEPSAAPPTSAPAEAPLTPHASGGMQTLQPPQDLPPATSTRPIDNSTPVPDTAPQPTHATPTLSPSSTLP